VSKKKKRNASAQNASTQNAQSLVRLSLCMIVKNEEKNIEEALSWAKEATIEQIVVDTGSTDNTVKIAESMGADVHFFEWINDFSAARNFSLEQASGNWIIVMDGDDRFSVSDANKLLTLLAQIESDANKREKYLAVNCTAINVDDNNLPTSSLTRVLTFRNDPGIRYFGRIHERLSIDDDRKYFSEDVKVHHTGYSETAKKESGKAERNIRLLREELKLDPNNMEVKAYLADSLSGCKDGALKSEAENIYTEILESGAQIHSVLRMKAYVFFIYTYVNDPEKILMGEEICKKALNEFPGALDFEYFLGYALNKKGDYQAAWDQLKKCEEKLVNIASDDESYLIPENPVMLYGQIMLAADGLGDVENVVMYSTQVLSLDNTRQEVLSSCIAKLLVCGASDNELLGLLSHLYDVSDQKNLCFIADAARACGATAFADRIMASRS